MKETLSKWNTAVQTGIRRANAYVASHKRMVLAVCLLVMILFTALKYEIYDETAFTSAYRTMTAVNTGDFSGGDAAFSATASVFHALFSWIGNISMRGWAWLLLVPGAAVFLWILAKAPALNLFSALTALGFSFLLPYFVFMPGVDFLQYLLFFVMALILIYVPGQIPKLIGCELVLLPVVLFLREYYVLMMIGAAVLFGVAILYRKPKTLGAQTLFLGILASGVILALLLLRVAAPDLTDRLFSIRTRINMGFESMPAPDKLILDLLPMDWSVAGFIVNFLFAAVRILIPVELCVNFSDIPFAVFQILLDILILIELVRSRRVSARTAAYSVIIAFFLMSFCFEPSFGSWFRHEAAAFPILWLGIGMDRETHLLPEGKQNG